MVDTHESHVLVLAPGHRPAAVLERAVVRCGQEQRLPHQIHVLAPPLRVSQIERDLLSPERGASRFAEICRNVGVPRNEIHFNHRTLHPIEVNADAGASAVERIVQLLRSVTSASDVMVTAVVSEDAGGAGHLLHAALQVAGRGSDRLLLDVSMEIPGRRRRRPVSLQPVPVHIEVPFVLWPANEPAPATCREAVERRRAEHRRIARPDLLRFDCLTRVLSVGNTRVRLPAMQFFWMYYLAATPGERFPLSRLSSALSVGRRQPAQVSQKLSDGRVRLFPADLQRAFGQLLPHAVDKFDAMYQRCCGPQPGLPSTISKINSALRRALGGGAGPYLIQGGRGAGGYRITLPASAIQIIGLDARHP